MDVTLTYKFISRSKFYSNYSLIEAFWYHMITYSSVHLLWGNLCFWLRSSTKSWPSSILNHSITIPREPGTNYFMTFIQVIMTFRYYIHFLLLCNFIPRNVCGEYLKKLWLKHYKTKQKAKPKPSHEKHCKVEHLVVSIKAYLKLH